MLSTDLDKSANDLAKECVTAGSKLKSDTRGDDLILAAFVPSVEL